MTTAASANPLVTVVIPCYNHAHFLSDALASARRQDYEPIEVIVVDDGSTDGCAGIAESQGARVFRQDHSGLGAARNAGLCLASGEFVIFLDADDELLHDAVESGVAVLREHPDLACVVRRCQVMDAERRAQPTIHTPLGSTDLYREWLQRNFVWTPGAAVFRRVKLAAIGGFPPDLGPAADYAVYLALSRQGEVKFEQRDAVRYRQHDSNMSRDPVLMLRATLDVLRRERGHVPARYVKDYRTGLRSWRAFYGEQIVERLRRERRAGAATRWQKEAIWTLVTECPRVLATHASRKLSRLARGIPSEPIEPGRSGPQTPAPPRGQRGTRG